MRIYRRADYIYKSRNYCGGLDQKTVAGCGVPIYKSRNYSGGLDFFYVTHRIVSTKVEIIVVV